MATSIPTFQNVVLYNTSTTKYCGLYFRANKNDVSGDITNEYYYMPSNSLGAITDRRGNALNNAYYSTYADAVANYPAGYGTVTIDPGTFKDERIISYNAKFPFSNNASRQRAKDEHYQAYINGARNFIIAVEWGQIFTSYDAQIANNPSAYANVKDLADYTLTLGSDVKLSFRMRVDLDDERLQGAGKFYDLFTDQAQDENYNPARIGYGSGHVSLAFTEGVNKAKDFVTKFMTYVYGLYGTKIYWVSFPFSAQNETGYNYENQEYRLSVAPGLVSNTAGSTTINGSSFPSEQGFYLFVSPGDPLIIDGTTYTVQEIFSATSLRVSPAVAAAHSNSGYQYKPLIGPYPQDFDYSTHGRAAFVTAMQSEYGTIGALNTSWKETNLDWSTVIPPHSGSTLGGDRTTAQLALKYANNKGKNWYKFNHGLIIAFIDTLREAILAVAPTVKITLEYGSNVDDLAILRKTLLVKGLDQHSDMLKTQLGRLSIMPDLALTMDVMRPNYSGKLGTELNDSDLGFSDAALLEQYNTEIGYGAIDAGAKDIIIISNLENTAWFGAMMRVLKKCKEYMNSGNLPDTSNYKKVNFSIGQQLENINALKNIWKANGGSHDQRIDMIQSDDYGFGSSSGCQYPLSIYTFQSFCLKGPDIKSYQWTDADLIEPKDNATLTLLRNTKVRCLGATHPIVYTGENGDQIKCDWRVVGANDGIVYISNKTTSGWKYVAPDSNNYQPPQNNNHPDRRYIKTPAEDSVFYFPNTQNYIVYMTNTGTIAFTMSVEVLNIDQAGNSITVFSKRLVAGSGEQSYTINTANIPFQDIRQFKINCNRWGDTDNPSTRPDVNIAL